MSQVTITSGGTVNVVPGTEYIIAGGTTGTITFTGSGDFTVTMNENLTSGSNLMLFDTGTTPTVNVGAGVDVSGYTLDANGDSLAVTIGAGTTVGTINADSVNGVSGSFDLTAGDNVTVQGSIDGPNATSATNLNIGNNFLATGNVTGSAGANNTMTFGDNMTIGGRLTASGTGDTILNVGNTSSIGNSLDLRGSGDRTATFGNDATITGNLDVRASGTHSVTMGDGATVTADVNFSGGQSATFVAGDNFAVGVNFVTTQGDDGVIIGNNWTVGGNIDLLLGNDSLNLGASGSTSGPVTTIVFGNGSTGSGDGLTVAAPLTEPERSDFITAATNAGFVDNGDGTVSGDPGASAFFDYGGVRYQSFETQADPICFTAGTQIMVENGGVRNVEDLRQGDMVMTADNGLQEIKWISSRTLRGAQLRDEVRPVRISAGALGNGLPTQDLFVSPQHRMLVRSKIAQRMVGTDEVLVAAKHLLALDGIDVMADATEVTYVHFLCDRHEVVFANNSPSETLYTGPEAMKAVPASVRTEIIMLFPELADLNYKALSARPVVPGRRGRKMVARHKKNDRPLLAHRH